MDELFNDRSRGVGTIELWQREDSIGGVEEEKHREVADRADIDGAESQGEGN